MGVERKIQGGLFLLGKGRDVTRGGGGISFRSMGSHGPSPGAFDASSEDFEEVWDESGGCWGGGTSWTYGFANGRGV